MLELLSEQSESTRTQVVTQRVPLDILVTVNKLYFFKLYYKLHLVFTKYLWFLDKINSTCNSVACTDRT